MSWCFTYLSSLFKSITAETDTDSEKSRTTFGTSSLANNERFKASLQSEIRFLSILYKRADLIR